MTELDINIKGMIDWTNKLNIKDKEAKKVLNLLKNLESIETKDQLNNISSQIEQSAIFNNVLRKGMKLDSLNTTDYLVNNIAGRLNEKDEDAFIKGYNEFKAALKETQTDMLAQAKELTKILGPMAGLIILSLLIKIPLIPLAHGFRHEKEKKKSNLGLKVSAGILAVNSILMLITVLLGKEIAPASMVSQGIWIMFWAHFMSQRK